MDISDEALENSLDDLIDEGADFLDIETEEMLLEESFDSIKLNKNKISKDQTFKTKIENSESEQNFVEQSQTKNIKEITKQENSNVNTDSAKQNSEKWNLIRKARKNRKRVSRGGNNYRRHQNYFVQDNNGCCYTNYNHNNRNSFDNFITNSLANNSSISNSNICKMNMEMNCKDNLNSRKWLSRGGNNYRRHQNNFVQDHNDYCYTNNRNSFDNFLTNSLANNSCISNSNMCKMNMEMNCKNNLNTRPQFLSNIENNQRNFMSDQQSFYKSNELINLIRCSSRANVFSNSNMCNMNCENNLNTWPNFLSNFEYNFGNFMMDQSINKSNELINLIRCSSLANMKLDFITLIALKLFDLIDLIQKAI